jgi:hypothetical protein
MDGAIHAEEWGGATVLQPLMREGSMESFSTRVSLGWSPDVFFIAIQHERPANTPMQPASASKDRLALSLTAPNGNQLKLGSWGGVGRLEPDDPAAVPSWKQAGTACTHGWTTEISLPLRRLGSRQEIVASGVTLEIELLESSLGAKPNRLTTQLRFSERQLAFRFLEAGEFEGGANQGCMVELVNTDQQPANLSVRMDVSPIDGDGRRLETEKLLLPGDARRRIRLAFPATRGEYRVGYQFSLDGVSFANGGFGFHGGGPMQASLIPFHLWRGGMFVQSSLPGETNTITYAYSVKASRDTQSVVLGQTTGKGNETTEQFVPTSWLRPGPYILIVTATRDSAVLAERTIPFLRPEYPKWWKPRQ